jgi:hypothetical protein
MMKNDTINYRFKPGDVIFKDLDSCRLYRTIREVHSHTYTFEDATWLAKDYVDSHYQMDEAGDVQRILNEYE